MPNDPEGRLVEVQVDRHFDLPGAGREFPVKHWIVAQAHADVGAHGSQASCSNCGGHACMLSEEMAQIDGFRHVQFRGCPKAQARLRFALLLPSGQDYPRRLTLPLDRFSW